MATDPDPGTRGDFPTAGPGADPGVPGQPGADGMGDRGSDDRDPLSAREALAPDAPATAAGPGDAARTAAIEALARTGAPVDSGAAASGAPVARPTDADLDGLLARIVDRARMTIDAGGTSLTTELQDPVLGMLRLAVMEDAAGLIRAVLTAVDPSSVALLQQAADRHRAAGEMASIDLRIRSEADPGRERDPRGETAAGSTPESRTAPDGRRPGRDDSSPPPAEVRLIDRPVRARRDTITDPHQRSSRLGRTIDRIA